MVHDAPHWLWLVILLVLIAEVQWLRTGEAK
jgi:hypothetical protein